MGRLEQAMVSVLVAGLLVLSGCGGAAERITPAPVTPAPVPNANQANVGDRALPSVVTLQNTRNETYLVTLTITKGTGVRVIYRDGTAAEYDAPISTGTAATDGPIDHVEPRGDPIVATAYQIDPKDVQTVRLGHLPENVTLVYTVRPVDPTDRTPPLSQWGATRCAGVQCEHLFLL